MDILDRLLKEPKLLETKIQFEGFTEKHDLPPNLTFDTQQEKELFEIIYNWGMNINQELEKEKEQFRNDIGITILDSSNSGTETESIEDSD